MAQTVLANDEKIDSEEHWFTVSIDQEDDLDDSTGESSSRPLTDGADAAVENLTDAF